MAKEIFNSLTGKQAYGYLEKLRGKLRLWRVISQLTIITLLIVAFFVGREFIRDYSVELKIDKIDREAPYSKEVKDIIKSLQYSGLTRLKRPDVWIELDFINRTWILHNVHRFDSEGNIILADGKSGVCGDLARYVYKKINPLFKNNYKIEFINVVESSYFMSQEVASHIVLSISKPGMFLKRTYILDPSFRRYGSIEQFEDYLFIETVPTSHMMNAVTFDEVYGVGRGVPLLIKKHHLIQLDVNENDGKFDKDNFVFAITATQRYKFAGRYVFALRKNDGKVEQLENERAVKELLSDEEYTELRNKVVEFFERYNQVNE